MQQTIKKAVYFFKKNKDILLATTLTMLTSIMTPFLLYNILGNFLLEPAFFLSSLPLVLLTLFFVYTDAAYNERHFANNDISLIKIIPFGLTLGTLNTAILFTIVSIPYATIIHACKISALLIYCNLAQEFHTPQRYKARVDRFLSAITEILLNSAYEIEACLLLLFCISPASSLTQAFMLLSLICEMSNLRGLFSLHQFMPPQPTNQETEVPEASNLNKSYLVYMMPISLYATFYHMLTLTAHFSFPIIRIVRNNFKAIFTFLFTATCFQLVISRNNTSQHSNDRAKRATQRRDRNETAAPSQPTSFTP